MPTTKVVVLGVGGRMGQQIANAALDDRRHDLCGATLRPDHEHVGRDIGELLHRGSISITASATLEQALASADENTVVVDFTLPHLCCAHAQYVAQAGLPLVIGTTGLDDDALAALQRASEEIPVLLASNTSLGANLLAHAVSMVAGALNSADVEVDAEIVEFHHRMKRDAPSGTALMLGEAIADARGATLDEWRVTERTGDAPRINGDIGIFGVRGGTVPGEHTAYFFLDDERIELTHRVSDRRVFATGALTAARFLRGKPAGQYGMKNVLGLQD
ncbi:MAG: 4-hydroxy-tetrahydrodipicolinate reductase [Deltaproteobacteria bacterium]|nr:4-hydroxy-tetrahydrodipicolinate reductase [Deltaproteobacteria bacterium]